MECGVCMMEWDSESVVPRNLPCGHTVCESCLKSMWKQATQSIDCPHCRV